MSFLCNQPGNGGDLGGMTRFCQNLLEELNENTAVAPGHRPTLTYTGMVNFVSTFKSSRQRISNLIDAGMSLKQIPAEKPTAEFGEILDLWGNPEKLIDRTCLNLAR